MYVSMAGASSFNVVNSAALLRMFYCFVLYFPTMVSKNRRKCELATYDFPETWFAHAHLLVVCFAVNIYNRVH